MLAYLFIATVFVRSFITVHEIPSAALGPELNKDYDERTSYMSFRYLFGWVGGVTMYVLAFGLLLRPDATHAVGQLNPNGYHRYGIVAAIVMFLSMLVSSVGTLFVLYAIAIYLVAGYAITRRRHAANLLALEAAPTDAVSEEPRLHAGGPHT